MQIYPNPTSDVVIISGSESFASATLEITDISGKIVYSDNEIKGSEIKVDLSLLSSGTYMLRVIDQENIYLSKVIKK